MKKLKGIERRRKRIRKKIIGTEARPRMNVTRSNKNISIQLIDDMKQHTLLSLSTRDAEFKKSVRYGGNVKAASALGTELAKKAALKGINKVVFDRAGYPYHGRIKTLADAARKGGLSF